MVSTYFILQEWVITAGQEEIIKSSHDQVRRVTDSDDILPPVLSESIIRINLENVDDYEVKPIGQDLENQNLIRKGLLLP